MFKIKKLQLELIYIEINKISNIDLRDSLRDALDASLNDLSDNLDVLGHLNNLDVGKEIIASKIDAIRSDL